MSPVSRQAVPSIVTVLVLLMILNLLMQTGTRELQEAGTSLGHGVAGEGAVFDLLTELGFDVARSYERPLSLPSEAVVWLIDPRPQVQLPDEPRSVVDELLPFVEGGGTAVVFGGPSTDWTPLPLSTRVIEDASLVRLAPGPLDAPDPTMLRTIELDGPLVFVEDFWPAEARVRLHDPEDGSVFALEIERGAGRIVAISDGRFLENAKLVEADAAVLAVDLAHAYGAPLFDERFHGLRTTPTFWEVAGAGRVGLALLVLLALGWTTAALREPWPPRDLDEPERPEVTLRAFVDALTRHYARTRDWADAFAAYREGALHRLRGRADRTRTEPSSSLVAQLARENGLAAPIRDHLVEGRPPGSLDEALAAAHAIERFVEERT